MDGIVYRVGDATDPAGEGCKIIAHVCNDVGAWGRGFVLAVSARWSEPEIEYRLALQPGPSLRIGLGAVQFVQVGGDVVVANMIAQRNVRPGPDGPPIRYNALRACLRQVAERALRAPEPTSVHMPRIGCGLAGGEWTEVEAIIQSELVAEGVPVYVYDLPRPGPPRRCRAPPLVGASVAKITFGAE